MDGRGISARLAALPWGLVGMIGLVVVVECFVTRLSVNLQAVESWEWARSSRLIASQATSHEILCFGSSNTCFSVLPPLIKEQLGKRAFNFALCGGPTPTSYFLLRRGLEAGAKPAAVVVDYHPEALSIAPWAHPVFLPFWPELLTARECLELSWSARDPTFFARTLMASVLPSIKNRYRLRDGIKAIFSGKASSRRSLILAMKRNKRLNQGALLQPANLGHFHGEIQKPYRCLLPDRWSPHPGSELYVLRFIELAASRGIPVFWVIPPFAPALQEQREKMGLAESYRQFARGLLDRHPNLVVVSALQSGYTVPAFADTGHLSRQGAIAFSNGLAAALRTRLDGPCLGPRWVDLPPYRDQPTSVAMEDLDQSAAALQKGELRR